jgi:hypothetical protein
LALASLTGGDRSIGIVRLRTKNHGVSFKKGYGSKMAVLQSNDDALDSLVIHNGKLLRAFFPV